MTTELRFGAASDVGLVRAENQDRFLAQFPIFVVADGMGGYTGGEIASQMAVDTIREEFANNSTANGLRNAVMRANDAIWAKAEVEPNLHGMGTTLTGLALILNDAGDDEVLCVVNVGDSRTYALRLGELIQISEDHSVPEEMVRLGLLRADQVDTHEKRHMLTRALGAAESVDVDTWTINPYKGERYLMCSDGLVNEITEGQISAILRRVADPQDAAKELVTMAVARGGNDNITVIVVDVMDDGGRSLAKEVSAADTVRTYGSDEVVEPEALEAPTGLTEGAPGELPASKKVVSGEGKAVLTWRLALFVALFLTVLLGGLYALRWYAGTGATLRSEGNNIVLFEGQDGGVLWWKPSQGSETGVTLDALRPEDRDQIVRGRNVGSINVARQLLSDLVAAGATARGSQADAEALSAFDSGLGVTTTTTTIPLETSTTFVAP